MADAILERPVAEVQIGDNTYQVAPPCLATLILVSEIVSTFPAIDANVPKNEMWKAVLHHAKDFKAICDIAAVLILGAKGLTGEEEREVTERRFFGLIRKKKVVKCTVDLKARLAKDIAESMTSSEIFHLLMKRINLLDVGNFFALTTSLSGVNLLKPTREVEN